MKIKEKIVNSSCYSSTLSVLESQSQNTVLCLIKYSVSNSRHFAQALMSSIENSSDSSSISNKGKNKNTNWSIGVSLSYSYLPDSLISTLESNQHYISTQQRYFHTPDIVLPTQFHQQNLFNNNKQFVAFEDQKQSTKHISFISFISPWKDWCELCPFQSSFCLSRDTSTMSYSSHYSSSTTSLVDLVQTIFFNYLGFYLLPTWLSEHDNKLYNITNKANKTSNDNCMYFTSLKDSTSDAEQFCFVNVSFDSDSEAMVFFYTYPSWEYLEFVQRELCSYLPDGFHLQPDSSSCCKLSESSNSHDRNIEHNNTNNNSSKPNSTNDTITSKLHKSLLSELSSGSESSGIQIAVGQAGTSVLLTEKLFQQYMTDIEFSQFALQKSHSID